jgi:transmembrane sensor
MSTSGHFGDERRQAAADWIVRLRATDLSEADALAFDAWISAPDNARAYDAALAVDREFAVNAAQVVQGLAERRPAKPARRGVFIGFGAAAAAAAVAVVVAPQFGSPKTETYATRHGEQRTITLADGSRLDLNAGTRLTVTLARDVRRVVLDEGQAVFDVAPDHRKPFVIAAGDRIVRVVGTQFDVRRRDGKLAVTVASGTVEVRPAEGAPGQSYRLRPGHRLEHEEGQPGVKVSAAEPAEVLGWRAGRLVYRGQPLSEVVADLNRQFATPLRIEDADLGRTPISGVLVLDDQDAVIRRLALLVPITAVPSEAGLVLRRDGTPGR